MGIWRVRGCVSVESISLISGIGWGGAEAYPIFFFFVLCYCLYLPRYLPPMPFSVSFFPSFRFFLITAKAIGMKVICLHARIQINAWLWI